MAKKRKRAVPARAITDSFTNNPDIKQLHEAFDYATDAWSDIRDEAQTDMRYISGDPWEPEDRAARDAAGRPVLSMDELGQYVNQVINDVRQNKRAIKVTPLGNGANDQTAALRADLFRQIEYRSNAQQAYTTMFENAVQRSYGYARVKAQFTSARSRHQELLIEPLMDPDLVTPDPDAVKPDLADMKFLFNGESWNRNEFKRFFPKAKVQDFTTDMMNAAPRWVKDERIMLSEWWQITTAQKKLLYVDVPAVAQQGQPPTPPLQIDVFEDEVAALRKRYPNLAIVGDRMADVPRVSMRLTNGIEILEETDWKGQYIPFVSCFGKIIYVDNGAGPERQILSAIRLARDPAMLYCYYRTGEAGIVGMTTKFPYFVRRGSLKPEEALKLATSLHEPVAFIQVEMMGDGIPQGVMPEMPVRNPFAPEIQAMEIGAEGARRAIQAGMGISPLPTSAQRRNEKSGVALKQIDESAQKGTFHFVDHYEGAIQRLAVICDDLIPHYYDAARDLTVRKADDTPIQVRVNDPNAPPSHAPAAQPYGTSPAIGTEDHDLTLSTGPSFDSEREAANDFSDTLLQHIQEIAGIAGPKAAAQIMALGIKLKDIGPLGGAMADIISPPETGQPSPAQLQQAMQQLQAENAQLKQDADDNSTKKAIAAQKNEFDAWKAKLESETKIYLADSASKNEAAIADIEARLKLITDLSGLAHEERMAERDHAHRVAGDLHQATHEVALAAVKHEQSKELASQQHEQALEQGAQSPPIDPNRELAQNSEPTA